MPPHTSNARPGKLSNKPLVRQNAPGGTPASAYAASRYMQFVPIWYEYDSQIKDRVAACVQRNPLEKFKHLQKQTEEATLNRCSTLPHDAWIVSHGSTETHTPKQ